MSAHPQADEYLTGGNTTIQYSSLAQSVEHLTVNQGVAGSSPAGGAKKERSDHFVLFLSKPQAWYIIDARSAAYIISPPAGLYLITRQRASYLRLDDMQHFVLMIYNTSC